MGAIVEEHLPHGSGIEVCGLLASLKPAVPVVLVCSWPNFDRALRAARSGLVVLPAPRTSAQRHRLVSFLNDGRATLQDGAASNAASRASNRRSPHEKLVLDGSRFLAPTETIWLTPVQQRLLDVLARRPRQTYVSPTELARRAFGRVDSSGGTLVRRHISLMRRALGSYGWVIESRLGHGYRLAGVVKLA